MKSLRNLSCAGALLALAIVMLSSCGGGGGKSGPVIIPPKPEWATPVGRWDIAGEPDKYLVGKIYNVRLAISISDPVNRGEDEVLIALYGKGENPAFYPASATLKFVPTGDTLVNELGEFEKNAEGSGTVSFQVQDTDGHILTTVFFTRNFVDGTPSPPPPPTNHPPVVQLLANPASGNAPLQVTLMAAATDTDGTIVKYEWAFPGDATYSVGNATMILIFPTQGSFIVKVKVTDDDGATDTDDTTITVSNAPPPANQPPVAKLKLIGSSIGQVPFTVQVDASESYDPDGSIVWYDYFFYGGGGHSEGSSNLTTFSNTYTAAGSYSIWLRVTDNDGAQDWTDIRLEVTVTAPSMNNDLIPVDGTLEGYYSGAGQQSLTLELVTPISSVVGFVLWEITEGLSGAVTVPLGNQPCGSCEFYYDAAGTYKMHAMPYESEQSYQDGDAAIGGAASFIITIIAG